MIVRLARKILGIKSVSDIDDPIHYNSKENIDALHRNFRHFRKVQNNAQKSVENFFQFMKDKGLLSNDLTILDSGCGSANLLNLISSEFPSADLTGADFSESKLNQCRTLYPHIKFELNDIHDELEKQYDLILCTEVLEHLLYPHRALKSLLTGVSNAGKVFITVPNGRLDSFSGHINFWSPESWKVFIEENITGDFRAETGLIFHQKINFAIIEKQGH
jgi:2-polyprenyl-3-methyl-5-hydroxy-6-metoxy-1,4-benzoquinol methylase